jgi:hypothetical protein
MLKYGLQLHITKSPLDRGDNLSTGYSELYYNPYQQGIGLNVSF